MCLSLSHLAVGYGLTGHVIRKYSTWDGLACSLNCLTEYPNCESMNFNTERQSGSGMNCVLSNPVMSEYPEDLQIMRNVECYEMLKNVRHCFWKLRLPSVYSFHPDIMHPLHDRINQITEVAHAVSHAVMEVESFLLE